MRRMLTIPVLLLISACSSFPVHTSQTEERLSVTGIGIASPSPEATSSGEPGSARHQPRDPALVLPPPAHPGAETGRDGAADIVTVEQSTASPSPGEERPESAGVQGPGTPGQTETGQLSLIGRETESGEETAADMSAESGASTAAEETSGEEAPAASLTDAIIPADQLASGTVRLFPRGILPVLKRGKPLSVVFDFDGNGYTDVCVLGVETDSRSRSEAAYLSDFSRLFRDPPERMLYSVELFLQEKGNLVHSASIELNEKRVLDSMSLLPLSSYGSYPAAVAVEFLNEQGSETELVIFSGRGAFRRFTLFDGPEKRTHMKDIDRDGILDVLLEERSVEAGTGYETFLTWFRWTEREFGEQASVNIVRNLRGFLQKARELLISGTRKDFLLFALTEDRYAEIRASRSYEILLSQLFTPASLPGTGKPVPFVANPLLLDRRIIDVVFPMVTECPFSFDGDQGHRFSLPLRIRFEDNDDFYFYATIELSRNPFSGRQYSFTTR